MTSSFELFLISDQHPAEPVRTNITNSRGELTTIAIAGGMSMIRRLTADSKSTSDWVILADHSSPLVTADFVALAQALPEVGPLTTGSAVHLQPWNVESSSELFAWQTCGARVASCWSNPASQLAVCLTRPAWHTVVQSSSVAYEEAAENGSPALVWHILIQAIAAGATVTFPNSPTGKVWLGRSSDLDFRPPRLIPDDVSVGRNWLKEYVLSLKPNQLVPEKRSDADAVAIKAGICQWHDWLSDSHQLSQSIEGLGRHHSGDYWHAIQHRREPDYANARYWFRQLGQHPVFSQLAPLVSTAFQSIPGHESWNRRLLKQGAWDPFAFVDLCEACDADETQPLALAARQLQAAEMQLLLAQTYQDCLSPR